MTNHLLDTLKVAAGERHASVFARRPDGTADTYGDIVDLAGRIAAVLLDAGLMPGDRVAAQTDKSVEAIALYLATVMAGGAFLPLNTAYTSDEMAFFLGDAAPRVAVVDPARQAALAPAITAAGVPAVLTLGADGGGSLIEAAAGRTPAAPIARGPDDLAAILYTSGTTGRAKGAMLSHRNLASNAATLAAHWRFTADDVLIHALPIFHTHGLFVATNVVMATGGTLIFLPAFDADRIVAAFAQGATALMGVPTFYTRLLKHPGLTRAAVAGMRLFVSGSAPLLSETHRDWQARTGHAILERYGMTETNMLTSNPYEGERRAGTVGFPLPDVAVRIADPDSGAPLADGEIGAIEVAGPNVFGGYWGLPEKTRQEFRADGFFITGDLGRFDAEGYLHIVGRSKDLIISGGFNVYPKEVEALIDGLPGVAESAVIGLPHTDFGEAVTAVVVPRDPAVPPQEPAVLAGLAERLARYKQPKRVLVVDALPRNAMGKVQKAALRETYAGLYGGGG